MHPLVPIGNGVAATLESDADPSSPVAIINDPVDTRDVSLRLLDSSPSHDDLHLPNGKPDRALLRRQSKPDDYPE